MTSPLRLPARLGLASLIALGAAGAAQAATVGRCTVLIEDVYVPALVVDTGEGRVVHSIGDNGLTRGIVFDPEQALAWAAGIYGADLDYADTCGAPSPSGSDTALAAPPAGTGGDFATPAVAPPPVAPPPVAPPVVAPPPVTLPVT